MQSIKDHTDSVKWQQLHLISRDWLQSYQWCSVSHLTLALVSSPTKFYSMILNMIPECVVSESVLLIFLEILWPAQYNFFFFW